tara:strand:- start:619 stop:1044 length:426 start_codon:yes stop_codon:yes gene_type:complete
MKKSSIVIALLLLGACSSNQLSEAPSWYTEPPKDKENIYASGFASDTSLQFAMEVADLSAKRSLASQLSSTINGKSRYYRGANGKNLSEIAAIDKITNVNLGGYKREEIEVEEEDGQYSVYVLLAYPLSNVSKEPKIFEGM